MVVAVTVVIEGHLHLVARRVRQDGAELIAAPQRPVALGVAGTHDDRRLLTDARRRERTHVNGARGGKGARSVDQDSKR